MCPQKSNSSAAANNGNGTSRSSKTNGNGNGDHPAADDTPEVNPITPLDMPYVAGGQVIRGFQYPEIEQEMIFQPSFSERYEQTEVITGDREQFEKIQKAIHDLLDAFNVNWEDPNYTDTPKRVAKAYLEYWASGYGRSPEHEVTVFPNSSGADDLVVVKDMKFYSMCSHHLAPFHGYGAIAYLPGENLLGLSKLGRILDIYARRFQLQERLGAQTADKLMELLDAQGVMVVLYDAEHMCMSSRGVQLHEANTTTVASRGVFKSDSALRNEVWRMLGR